MQSTNLLVTVLSFSFIFIIRANCEKVFVQTETAGTFKGKILTVGSNNYSVHLAIPYAKPPIGNLRFKVN